LFHHLQRGEFCYVFNARQMGKSSLRIQTSQRLQAAGIRCGSIDMSIIGTQQVTADQWYASIANALIHRFQLQVDLRGWWQAHSQLSLISRLDRLIETVLLRYLTQPLVIFVDEIDSLLDLDFSTEDFFVMIRACYSKRAEQPDYRRLSFALFGVTTPSTLIANKRRTPFNVGQAIELGGIQLAEATPLLDGLASAVHDPKVVLARILHWTNGQPFLTQKLCHLVVQHAVAARGPTAPTARVYATFVDRLVHTHLLHYWEAQDEPEHLRTIRDRLLRDEQRAGRLLGLYQQVLQAEPITPSLAEQTAPVQSVLPSAADWSDQAELLLCGLVENHRGQLRVKNAIYRTVFNSRWVDQQLEQLRPYSQALNHWVASGCTDTSWLLRGQALSETLEWSQGKRLSDRDHHFLAASQAFDRQAMQTALEAERLQKVEDQLRSERRTTRQQRWWLVALGLVLISTIELGAVTLYAYHLVGLSTVRAIVTSSQAQFESHHNLNALVQAIDAHETLQSLFPITLHTSRRQALETQVQTALQQAVQSADEFNQLTGHDSAVLSIAFSLDDRWIATVSSDKTLKLWQPNGQLSQTLKTDTTLHAVAFSPDSQWVAAAGLDGRIYLWSVDGQTMQQFQAHAAPVWGLAVSPDGQLIASASADRTIKIWHRGGTELQTLVGHRDAVWTVAFSPDGQTLASVSPDSTLKLWTVDGQELRTIAGHDGAVWSVAFLPATGSSAADPQMAQLVSSGADKTVRLWRNDGTLLKTLTGHGADVIGIAVSRDGQLLASASADKTVRLWHRDGTLLRVLGGHGATVRGVALSANGTVIGSASDDHSAKLWRCQRMLSQPLHGHKGTVWGASFSPDGDRFATVASDELKLWHADGRLDRTVPVAGVQLRDIDFSHNTQQLATANTDGLIRIRGLDGQVQQTVAAHQAAIWDIAFSPNDQLLASVGDDRSLKLWQRQSTGLFRLAQTFEQAHQSRIWDVTFSADGSLLATAGEDGSVKLWQRQRQGTFVPHQTLSSHESPAWGVAIHPDGGLIASAGRDGMIKLWRRDGVLLRTIEGNNPDGHNLGFTRLDFSPDGDTIAAAGVDGTITLWTLDGRLLLTLTGHRSSVVSLDFSPDGKTIVSGGDDQIAFRWDVEQLLQLDPIAYGCRWLKDYLKTNPTLNSDGAELCQGQ
jgi:WD40 repeat protein